MTGIPLTFVQNAKKYMVNQCPENIDEYIDCLLQDCSNPSANALEILQSWTKPPILPVLTREHNTHIQHRKSYCVVKWLYVTWQQNSMTIHIRVRNLWRIDTRFLHDSIVSRTIQCQLYNVYNSIYSYSVLLLLCINSTYSLDTSIVFILQICMIYTMFPVKYSWHIMSKFDSQVTQGLLNKELRANSSSDCCMFHGRYGFKNFEGSNMFVLHTVWSDFIALIWDRRELPVF